MTIKIDSQGLISLEGKIVHLNRLNTVQAQCVLLKLGFDDHCLFDTLTAFDDHGWNEAVLGLCGGFMFGEYKGINQ